MERREAGFTLIELAVGAAIASLLIWGLLALAGRTTFAAQRLNARLNAQAAADRLTGRLASEAASAWAVFVPPADRLGRANADGHELDFFAEDGSHRSFAWAYLFDPRSKRLTRYAYDGTGVPVAGEIAGSFDAFSAAQFDVTQLTNPASAAYDPLFANAVATPVTYAYAAMPGAAGGNGLVRVQLRASGVQRDELLASGTAPTRFTIVIDYTPSPPPAATPTAPAPTMTSAPTPGA